MRFARASPLSSTCLQRAQGARVGLTKLPRALPWAGPTTGMFMGSTQQEGVKAALQMAREADVPEEELAEMVRSAWPRSSQGGRSSPLRHNRRGRQESAASTGGGSTIAPVGLAARALGAWNDPVACGRAGLRRVLGAHIP